MNNSKKVKSSEVALSACTSKPVGSYDTYQKYWTTRVTLESSSPKCFLPLFVHVYRGKDGNFSAEIESDQTDYNKDNGCSVRRARINRLKFFTRDD